MSEVGKRDWVQKALQEILPATCASQCTAIESNRPSCMEGEQIVVGRLSSKRANEFCAGRTAARLAMQKLGISKSAIPIGEYREPIWPKGVVGSIAHSNGLAIAAVCKAKHLLSVGIDLERVNAVEQSLWTEFLSAKEIEGLNGLSHYDAMCRAAAYFALKEAYFKFQFPITREWLEFKDVEIASSTECYGLTIRLLRKLRLLGTSTDQTKCLWTIGEGFVVASVFKEQQIV